MSELNSKNPRYIANRENLIKYQRQYMELNPVIITFWCTGCKKRMPNGRFAKQHTELTGHIVSKNENRIRGNSVRMAVLSQWLFASPS